MGTRAACKAANNGGLVENRVSQLPPPRPPPPLKPAGTRHAFPRQRRHSHAVKLLAFYPFLIAPSRSLKSN